MEKDIYKQRYSVRKFKLDKIDRSVLLDCMESARLAPSACNVQPWKFIIVDDNKKLSDIVNKGLSGVHSFNQFVTTAPAIVAVVADNDIITNKIAAGIKGIKYYLFDIGIASHQFILKAWEKGIGSCYIGWFNKRKIKKILKIPFYKKLVMLIAVGYFDMEEKEKKRKSLNEIVFFNSYD